MVVQAVGGTEEMRDTAHISLEFQGKKLTPRPLLPKLA